jgi:hypothetical protein
MACHSFISHRLNDEAMATRGVASVGVKKKPHSKTRMGLTELSPVYISVGVKATREDAHNTCPASSLNALEQKNSTLLD